jgi:antitoxin HicB
MHARYTLQIEPQPGGEPGFLITSRDFPNLTSDGETWDEALRMGRGALLAILEILIDTDQPIPLPGGAPGVEFDLGTLVAAKIALNNLRVARGLNRAQLGQLIGAAPSVAYRTLSVLHASRMDQIDRALAAIGYRGSFVTEAAAAE